MQSAIFSFRDHEINCSASVGIQNMLDTRQMTMFVSVAVFVPCLLISSVWNVSFQPAGTWGGSYFT